MSRISRRHQPRRVPVTSVARSAEDFVAAMAPRHWYRADTYTLSAGNLSTLPNRGSAGGALTVTTGTLPAPAVDAALNGAPSVTFTAGQNMDSNLASSEFKFLHDGTGNDVFTVWVPTSLVASRVVWATRTLSVGAEVGAHLFTNASALANTQVCNGTSISIDQSTAALTVNVGTYVETSYVESPTAPEAYISLRDVYTPGVASTLAPSSANPVGTFRLGGGTGGVARLHGRVAEVLMFNRRLTPYERQLVREYIQARYGIAAPSYTGEARAVLKLNPFSWLRADSYTAVATKVGQFNDLVLPGHILVQATDANRVLLPTADAALANQVSGAFTAHWYDSNLATAAWRHRHNGAGVDEFVGIVPTNNVAPYILLANCRVDVAATGSILHLDSPSRSRYIVRNGATSVVDTNVLGQWTSGVGTYVEGWHGGGNYAHLTKSSVIASGAQLSSPASGDSSATLRLGAGTAGTTYPMAARWADYLNFSRVLTADERTVVQAYFQARYGL